MRKLVLAALGSAALLSGSSALSQSADAHPCVQEVCIGDGLEKLGGIDWQVVAFTSERVNRIRKEDRAKRARIFPGFGADGVPSYLIVGEFDRNLLRSMASVTAACARNGLTGTYVSQGGHKTMVTVSLLPTDRPDTMVWRVTTINRRYAALERSSERTELLQALNEKYGRFANRQAGESAALVVPLGKETVLSLVWVDVERDRLFGSHPRCGPAKKITL